MSPEAKIIATMLKKPEDWSILDALSGSSAAGKVEIMHVSGLILTAYVNSENVRVFAMVPEGRHLKIPVFDHVELYEGHICHAVSKIEEIESLKEDEDSNILLRKLQEQFGETKP